MLQFIRNIVIINQNYIIMKKIIFLLAAILTIGNTAFASFPVTENNTQTEVVVTSSDNLIESTESSAADMRWGGFFLGFFLGLIGVLIAYLSSDDKDFIRSTWLGAASWAVLYLLLLSAASGY